LKPFPGWRLPKGVINASDPELEKSIESCERWAWFGGGLVIVGVAAEVAIAAIHPPYDSFLEQWGSSLANSLVAIGVAFEIIFSRIAGLRQNELKRRSDERVAAANARAEEANQKAQEAALDLAKYRTPRYLTHEQLYRIAEKLKPFGESMMQYACASVGLDPEHITFLQFIEAALLIANWREIDWQWSLGTTRGAGRTTIGTGVSVSNVFITFPLENRAVMTAAVALMNALKEEGFVANVGPDASNHGIVKIMIGPKT
jgi:hypothetical protein